jgi:hypothetical protein
MACYYPQVPHYAINPNAYVVQSLNGGNQLLLTAKNTQNCHTNQNTSERGKDSEHNNSKSSSSEKMTDKEDKGKGDIEMSVETVSEHTQ